MLRTIKSFISREGRMTLGQKRALTTIAMQYEVNALLAKIDLPALFHNDNPIVLEIGFGSGDSLFAQAQAHPELNFFGIEVYRTGIAKLCNKLAQANIVNVLYACGDAVEIINKIAARSLERIQIFFPDPWPKTRHHKRRIVQPAFMTVVAQKLATNGIIHLATDWLDYAQHMQNVLELDCSELFEKVSALRPDFRPTTKFEIKGLAKGHQIYDLLYKLK
jgi:tRNA (guanine-N7-)-methyltransferase